MGPVALKNSLLLCRSQLQEAVKSSKRLAQQIFRWFIRWFVTTVHPKPDEIWKFVGTT